MEVFETSNVFNIVEELVNKLNSKMGGFLLEKKGGLRVQFLGWHMLYLFELNIIGPQ